MRRRNHTIAFRMNDEEYERYQRKLKESGQTSQSFLLRAVEGAVILPVAEVKVLYRICNIFTEHTRQIRGMATNINQMAHVANATGMVAAEDILKELAVSVKSQWKEGEEIWQSIRQLIVGLTVMEH